MRSYKDPDYRPEEFERLRETRLAEQDIFHGQILHLRKDTVRLPNGGTAPRELIVHVGAVCIVPVTEDGHKALSREWQVKHLSREEKLALLRDGKREI